MRNGLRSAVAGVALLYGAAGSLGAQKYPGPDKVSAQSNGASVTVTWNPVPVKGARYRVLRALDAKATGVDLTRPVYATTFDDGKVSAGTTYFYQVIAVFPDGTTGAADPVMVTIPAPAPMVAPVLPGGRTGAVLAPPVGLATGATGARSPLATPTAVTGIAVNGTLASAAVSWTPVTGAVSYSLVRTSPAGYGNYGTAPILLTTNTWTDPGPTGIGFPAAGVYRYDITAALSNGTSVSGSASWTRPDPTCAAPPPSQPNQPIIDPIGPAQHFTTYGPYPAGAVFWWSRQPANGVVGYRVDRSVQGSNAWTLAGTSCGTTPTILFMGNVVPNMRFTDLSGGITPGTTYVYRITALAANGEAGWNTSTWTAPNSGLVRWLSATTTATSITLQWRYEPPPTGAPPVPNNGYKLTSGYGLNVTAGPNACTTLAGCSYTISNPPKGAQQFTITARWAYSMGAGQTYNQGPAMGTLSADTLIVVP